MDFEDLRIRDLRFFERLGALGSITAAAVELGIPKATGSRWLAGLEARVGHTLVERTTRQLALNERGRAFLAGVRQVLAATDALHQVASTDEAGGSLRVSVPVPFGRVVGGAVVAAFRERMPGVRLEVRLENARVDLIRDGFDLAIRGGPLVDSDLVARKLMTVPLRRYCSARYEGLPASEVPQILAPGDAGLLAARTGERRQPDAVLDDRGAVADALRAGAGMGVLPAFLGDPAVEEGSLVAVDEAPLVRIPVHALFLPSRRQDHRLRVLIETIEAQLRVAVAS